MATALEHQAPAVRQGHRTRSCGVGGRTLLVLVAGAMVLAGVGMAGLTTDRDGSGGGGEFGHARHTAQPITPDASTMTTQPRSATPSSLSRATPNRMPLTSTPGFLIRQLAWEGATRNYVVYVPPAHVFANGELPERVPLIVFLHGRGECGTDGMEQLGVGLGPAIMRNVAAWPFIVLFPQKPAANDRWSQHGPMVMAMLEATRAEAPIDDERTYLTGISQGGLGTWDLAAASPRTWAAIAPVCGWSGAEHAEKIRAIPTWAFHGEADSVIRSEETERSIEALRRALQPGDPEPRMTIYPGVDHNSWDRAYRDEGLGAWFLGHRRRGT
ncbi:MAG: hypothetical protein SFZ23_14335 [Planctomycetota bacterium]|nr:hypothetical protein [Planctomycetota bacterium]